MSRYVKTGDDTIHPIEHIMNVPLSHVGKRSLMRNILHMPTITKNLVSVGQIVNQGMQFKFNHQGCFIEDKGHIIVRGRREGRMFILHINDVGVAMFVNGQNVESYIDLWHKRIGYINFPRLHNM